jgi:hypothetical protein
MQIRGQTWRRSWGAALAVGLACFPVAGRAAETTGSQAEEERVVERLQSDACVVVKDEGAGGGVTGARKLTLRFTDGEQIEVKWKPVPGGMEGWNNSPRKEIAAYAVQRLLLDPADYVIPATALRCLPSEAFASVGRQMKPNVKGAACELGGIGVWLHDVHIPENIYDPELFASDPVYARHMADMNLLTYLIKHQDGRSSNFVLANDSANRRVYSVDNGIAFGALVHNYFVENWDELRVPALRKSTIERLRATPPESFETLAVVVELKRDADGVLQPAPKSPSRRPKDGIFFADGVLQLGLSRKEIEALKQRREKLLEEVSAGRIETF